MQPFIIRNWIIFYFILGVYLGYSMKSDLHDLWFTQKLEPELEKHLFLLNSLVPLFLNDPDYYRPEICGEIYEIYVLDTCIKREMLPDELRESILFFGLKKTIESMSIFFSDCYTLEQLLEQHGLPKDLENYILDKYYKEYIVPQLIKGYIQNNAKYGSYKPPY